MADFLRWKDGIVECSSGNKEELERIIKKIVLTIPHIFHSGFALVVRFHSADKSKEPFLGHLFL